MAKLLKFGNAIVCEFAAKGERNKHTLVNVFSGDIVVQQMPARLHLGLYVEYLPEVEGNQDISLRIKLDEKVFAKFQVKFKELSAKSPTAIVIQAMQVGIDNDAVFSVEAESQGYRNTKVLSKRIYQGRIAAV
ncbi:hypothetical protein GN330_23345 [Nitratireductor sp. CAU 1489]|uniref:Uncharacterized protein n=1 Tax=Nitratireductor arenosus TaxID=2682096 RepID=A0A844QJX8_9HYPH|nr:hypothetical protein [Nitratireductor arenosus]MVB00187.1 hypothetical protein [Nitratireductor arenosus]